MAMVLVDVNVLVHAVNADSPNHGRVRGWLAELMGDGRDVGLPWVVLLGFVRITTHQRILPKPLSMEAALAQVEDWLTLPNVRIPQPTTEHLRCFAGLCREAR